MNKTNAQRYHFADFTRDNYRRLLVLAKTAYPFRTYNDFEPHKRFLLWRHDVDFSMQSALKLAQIEWEEGVKATYFLLPHSEFYNLLEKEVTDCVRDIVRLGHAIGLHFDGAYYDITDERQLEEHLIWEKNVLESVCGQPLAAFSFHNPSDFFLNCQQLRYAGLMNTYAELFQSDVCYCSDSNGYWRFERLEDVLRTAAHDKLQVLTHPGWWQEVVMSPKQRLLRCIDGRAGKTKQWYVDVLAQTGRKNIDWD